MRQVKQVKPGTHRRPHHILVLQVLILLLMVVLVLVLVLATAARAATVVVVAAVVLMERVRRCQRLLSRRLLGLVHLVAVAVLASQGSVLVPRHKGMVANFSHLC